MRQAYRIIPIYTADVSGVCSALYELGGMTVMHDPSGCNSTYNTHDEIRWYDQDSLIFISGLTDIDAIMGNDEKFLQDIEEAAKEKGKQAKVSLNWPQAVIFVEFEDMDGEVAVSMQKSDDVDNVEIEQANEGELL